MRKKDHDDELPPLYDVDVLPVERRLNVADRRAALRKAAERRRHPGRRATDPKPAAKKSRKKR